MAAAIRYRRGARADMTPVKRRNGTVAAIAEEWLQKRKCDWSDVHNRKSKRAVERDVLPLSASWPSQM